MRKVHRGFQDSRPMGNMQGRGGIPGLGGTAGLDDYGPLADHADRCVVLLGGQIVSDVTSKLTGRRSREAPDEIHPAEAGGWPTAGGCRNGPVFAAKTPHYVVVEHAEVGDVAEHPDPGGPGRPWRRLKRGTGQGHLPDRRRRRLWVPPSNAGLVDELRLIVYPLIVGEGQGVVSRRRRGTAMELHKVEQLPDGRFEPGCTESGQ